MTTAENIVEVAIGFAVGVIVAGGLLSATVAIWLPGWMLLFSTIRDLYRKPPS